MLSFIFAKILPAARGLRETKEMVIIDDDLALLEKCVDFSLIARANREK